MRLFREKIRPCMIEVCEREREENERAEVSPAVPRARDRFHVQKIPKIMEFPERVGESMTLSEGGHHGKTIWLDPRGTYLLDGVPEEGPFYFHTNGKTSCGTALYLRCERYRT